MKIMTVVGARPQFIKAAVVSRVLRETAEECLVHTGQHYDPSMSDVFFEELSIPRPDFNLEIAGGTHAEMTGRMMIALEALMISEAPDRVLVFGDTNSTLAAAIAAVKLAIPLVHVEAGARLGSLANPEEANRILTDHVAAKLLACTPSALDFLKKEGLLERSELTGDPMYDAFVRYVDALPPDVFDGLRDLDGRPVRVESPHIYLTCHRQENTARPETLDEILAAVQNLDRPVYYPVHPRNRERAREAAHSGRFPNVVFLEPVGYLASIGLVSTAERVVTDSGGVQREAFFARKPCVTVFDHVVWPETMVGGWNTLARPDRRELSAAFTRSPEEIPDYRPFGDGHAGEKIVAALLGDLSPKPMR